MHTRASEDSGRPAVEFRHATREDLPALVALVESAYRGEPSRQGWTTEAGLLDGQRIDTVMAAETLARPGTVVVMAEREGELLACCELECHGGDGHFGMFSVRPDQQGTGLGSRVLAYAGRLAVARGCSSMRMKVLRQRTDLIAWYERRGYRRTGVTSPFPYGDERFGRPKRADLEFVELAAPLPADGDPPGTGRGDRCGFTPRTGGAP